MDMTMAGEGNAWKLVEENWKIPKASGLRDSGITGTGGCQLVNDCIRLHLMAM